eukprot:2779077-Amphidinium_carterae.1
MDRDDTRVCAGMTPSFDGGIMLGSINDTLRLAAHEIIKWYSMLGSRALGPKDRQVRVAFAPVQSMLCPTHDGKDESWQKSLDVCLRTTCSCLAGGRLLRTCSGCPAPNTRSDSSEQTVLSSARSPYSVLE